MSQIKAKRKKLSAGDKAFNVFNYLLFGVFTLICIYPFYYMIINTISANNLSASGAINFLPQGVHLSNYKALLELNGLGKCSSCIHRKDGHRNSTYCNGNSISGIYVYAGKNVEAKILVSVCSYYDVFQCRSDPDVYHNEKLKFDEHILGVRDPDDHSAV